jgi:predicted secreted protein
VKWYSILAIFFIVWWTALFAVISRGLRTHDDDPDAPRVPGQATSAPVDFRPWPIILRTTVIAVVVMGLLYLNYVEGWVTSAKVMALFPPPASLTDQKYY